jgi:hypothetical protein
MLLGRIFMRSVGRYVVNSSRGANTAKGTGTMAMGHEMGTGHSGMQHGMSSHEEMQMKHHG